MNPSTPTLTLEQVKYRLTKQWLRSHTILETLITNQQKIKRNNIDELNRNKQRITQILLWLEKQEYWDDTVWHIKMYVAKENTPDAIVCEITSCIAILLQ